VQDSRAATLCHARGSSSLPARLRRHRVEAQKLALSLWPQPRLGQENLAAPALKREAEED